MGERITLELSKRDVHGKKVAKLRKDGVLPAVVYGSGMDPISVMAAAPVLEKVFKEAGKHHPVYLKIDGKARVAMIKDADIDPVKRRLRHISFHAVKSGDKVEAEVPIRLVGEGESAAEKAGLIVLQTVESINVKALPTNLPDAFEVSIVELAEAGDKITVGDIKLPKDVELVDNAAQASNDDEESHSVTELVVASVYEPSALQAANEAAGGDAVDEDVADVAADNGGDTDQASQAAEDKPGGKAGN